MPRLVTKFKYLKPTDRLSAGGYAEYIATREGAERIDDSQRLLPATEKQKKLIRRLLKDFPDSKHSLEHEDYLQAKTVGAASEFISRTIEEHADQALDTKTYADYIATRPRAERFGSHALFTDDGVPVQLSKVSEELNRHTGNIWTAIVSLRREDAERLGYGHGERWRDMLRSQTQTISEAFHIPMQNLKWFAAFHNESHHPHVHMIVYSDVPSEGFLSPAGVEQLRSSFARDVFAQDLQSIYAEQTEHRDALRLQSRDVIAGIVAEINSGTYDNPKVEDLLLQLAVRLSGTSGKKVYGYLKADVKAIVDSIVAELAADERISRLYDLWYEQREAVLHTYTDEMPERIPLSQNKEFKPIKNAVIQEAMNLVLDRVPLEEPNEPDDTGLPEPEPSPQADEPEHSEPTDHQAQEPHDTQETKQNLFHLYRNAKYLLERDTDHYDPEQAIVLLTTAAEQGYVWAQYRLGKLFLRGEDTEQNVDDALHWLGQAADQGNEWAQYLLGKTLLRGELADADPERAKELLEAAYRQGNRYAAYTLGKALLDGELLPQDISAALERLAFSAEDGFATAQYIYGKLLYRGEVLPQDIASALKYLEAAAAKDNAFAAYLAAKIYLTEESRKSVADAVRLFERAAELGNDFAEYQLGKLFLFGKEVPQDIPLALWWLGSSAKHGNAYAAQLLHSYHSGSLWPCTMGALRLLQQLARAFDNREQERQNNLRQQNVDRKLLRIIEEKRQAHGLKHGG